MLIANEAWSTHIVLASTCVRDSVLGLFHLEFPRSWGKIPKTVRNASRIYRTRPSLPILHYWSAWAPYIISGTSWAENVEMAHLLLISCWSSHVGLLEQQSSLVLMPNATFNVNAQRVLRSRSFTNQMHCALVKYSVQSYLMEASMANG